MAKKQLRINIDGQMIRATIFELDHMVWHETMMGCPYCREFSNVSPKLDVIQFGLMDTDLIHTVIQCEKCFKMFALHYINTYEVEE